MMFIKKIFLILLTCVLIICGVFIFFFGTKIGSNLIFTGIIYRIPELTVESISGSWGDFKFMHLAYHMSTGVIKIDELYVSIDLKYILFKQININHLFLKNVFIKIKNTKSINNNIKHYQTIQIRNIYPIIYSIIAKDIVLYNTHVISNNFEVQFQKLNTGLIFEDNLLKILPTYITEGSILNKFSLDLLKNKFNIHAIQTIFFMRNQLNLKCKLKTVMNAILKIVPQSMYNMPINFILTDIQSTNLYVYHHNRPNAYIINKFQMQISCNTKMINMKSNIHFPHGYVEAIGNIILHHQYPITLTINYTKFNINNHQSCQNLRNISLIMMGSLIDELCIRFDFLNIASVIHILFKIKLKSYGIPIYLLITIKKLPISLLEKKIYILEKLNLRITGELYNKCYVNMESQLICSDLLKIYISLCAQGNVQNCEISQLRLKILDGYCDVNGNINWKNSIHWNNTCIFNGINIAKKYFKSVPIELSGKIITNGYLSNDSWELIISQLQCHGNLNNKPITCHGSIYIGSNGKCNIPVFFVRWDSGILEIQGRVKKNNIVDISAKFKNIDCSNISSRLKGNLHGYCKLYGPVKSLVLLLKIHGYSLAWKEQLIDINDVLVDGNIHCNKLTQSIFLLKFNQIKYKNLLLYQLCIQGRGNIKEHYLNINIDSNDCSGIIHLSGTFDSKYKIWNSHIDKTSIITPMGTWKLMQDIIINYQYLPKRIILKAHSWKNDNCQFTVSNTIQKNIFEKINIICKKFNVIDLDLIPIDILNVDNFCISLTDFDWIIGNNVLPQGTVFITGSRLLMECVDDQKGILPVVMNDIIAKIMLTQTSLSGNLVINQDNNQNYGNFCITDLYNVPKILGKIYIQNLSLLPFLQCIFQSKISIKTVLNVDINVTGYLDEPKIFGSLKYNYDDINKCNKLFFIKKSVLQMIFFGNYAEILGMVETDYGKQLCLNGKITNFNSINSISILLNFTGNQVDMCISPYVYAIISPDIICTITANNIDIKGHIQIPSAQIKIQEFSKHIVDTSPEEIILDINLNPISEKSKDYSIAITSNLIIYLGNDINFNGLGLHTKLKGNLEIIYNNNDLNLIGHINMFSGYFEVYGQSLMIKKGQLLFSGAINQVYLDIEAIRNSIIANHIKDSVTAGVRITGMIDQLKLDFFSNSILLSQQEIISYLLSGQNLVLSDTNDTNMITSLLIGVSMKRYEKFINKIGDFLGVKDLRINTQNFGAPSLIALSGYIAPGLQIKYGISVFDLLTTVTIRYCICPHLYLEATSGGRYPGLDLLYQLYS